MNNINWREELLDSAKFNKKEENLLRHDAKSLAQSWHLGALFMRWKKLKEYREPPTHNWKSSFFKWDHRLAKGEFYVLFEDDFLYPDW